jgi:protoheme IX farnesyltransferase
MTRTAVTPPPAAAAPPARAPTLPSRWRQFSALTKPRVVQLIVFCAAIGMLLAVPGWPSLAEWGVALAATVGIWLVASAAAAFNCLVEQHIDAQMKRTAWRPTARGELGNGQTLAFATLLCGAGMAILWCWVNPLTMWLTFGTFVGYAVVYTVLLKPATPQNIVIGGASGAMPPVLGWAALRGEVGPEALMLCLIIFLWTPPHFWALALYRAEDYARAGLPMLPVLDPDGRLTGRQAVAHSLGLLLVSLTPAAAGMAGVVYLAGALLLGLGFLALAVRAAVRWTPEAARALFLGSLVHLSALCALLLLDRV